jgi:retron-type reverse transcriptase
MSTDPHITAFERQLYRLALKNSDAKFEPILSLEILEEATRRVLRRRGKNTPGVDGLRASDITDWPSFIAALWRVLLKGTYTPAPLRPVSVPKSSGGQRLIRIPTLGDRIVQHAFMVSMVPVLEADFLPTNWGARPGMNVIGALENLRVVLGRTGTHMLKVDVRQCFDRIRLSAVRQALSRRFCGSMFWRLFDVMANTWALAPGEGIPAGAPASPLFINVALSDQDEALFDRLGTHPMRWLDDVVVVVDGRDEAERCLELIRESLVPSGLELHPSKTEIVPVEQGTCVLGVHVKRTPAGEVQLVVDPTRLRASEQEIYQKKTPEKQRSALASLLSERGPYIEGRRAQQIVAEFHRRTGLKLPTKDWSRAPAVKIPPWMCSLEMGYQ